MAVCACGGISEEVDSTVATVTPIRGAATIGQAPAAVISRVTASDQVQTSDQGLTRVSLDLGPQLLLDRETEVQLHDGASLTLTAGRAFAQTEPGEQIVLTTPNGSLRAGGAAFSVQIVDGRTEVYVVHGEVSWTQGEERGIAGSGEELTLDVEGARSEAAVLWHDWTGGLARPGPGTANGPAGVGMLEARVPDEVGRARWPLVVRRLDVRVRVERDLAITEVDQLFFNPASETVEGLYRIRVPEGAVLQRFAVDRDERLVDGYVREKAQARAAYEAQVYRGSTEDPALLEWDSPSRYRARIYPIAPGATRRIVIRYAQWLRPPSGGTARLYRYPMGGGARAPHIQEFALSVDVAEAEAERVRAGMGAVVEQGAVRIRRSDFRPRSDFWLELVPPADATPGQRAWQAPHEPPARAPDAPAMPNEADERDYFYLPLVLPESLSAAPVDSVDLVILADVSAATDRSHLELGRSVVESLTAHLGDEDRVAIVSTDLTIRSVIEGEAAELGDVSRARVDRLLDGLARVPAGGATDLGEAVAAASALLDPARHGAVVYVGDGAPTVGEMRADGLIERFARLPEPVRLYAVAVGSDSNLELLETLTRGGGLTLRVEERAEAADAALRVLAHAARPIAHGIEVDLGTGIENAFPRRPMDAVLGEVFPVVGRVRDGAPSSVTVTGTIDGQPFREEIPVDVQSTSETTDLRLRWAAERLRQLLLTGAGREDVAELGTRYGLITPFTSYYVPSRRELSRMGPHALIWLDQPLLRVGQRRTPAEEVGAGIFTLALGPLALAGCRGQDEAPAGSAPELPYSTSSAVTEGSSADSDDMAEAEVVEEAVMGNEQSQRSNNRFGIQGAPAADMARSGPRRSARRPSGGSGGENDPLAGLDGVFADAPDEAAGDTSTLGLRGTGRGGGGTGEGTIGLGNLGTIGHGGGGGNGSGYGRGAGGLRGRVGNVPRVRTGAATVRGSLSREVIRRVIRRHINEIRFCYEQELSSSPGLAGDVNVRFVITGAGAVSSANVQTTTLVNQRVESCITQAFRRWTFPAPEGGGIVLVTYPITLSSSGDGVATVGARAPSPAQPSPRIITRIEHHTDERAHRHRRCSDAAQLTLNDRRSLWRERLGAQSSPAAWIRLYREAIRNCEAETWRDRRAFLSLILDRGGSIQSMTAVYSALSNVSARIYVRARILRRVRTPEDLRLVRSAFGLGGVIDWDLVEQIMERATTDAAKIRAMRRLSMQYAWSFEMKLRLLALLERTQHEPEAMRLADQLRADPLADPGVRTAIGEMFLRMDREDDARRVFSEIVEFAPLDELARRRLGDLYRAHGWHEDAYRQYETLREIRPDDPSVQLLLAQAAAGAGRIDEALRLERSLMQTSEPGASQGVARTALLWSSVRYARLRKAAQEAGDEERIEQLDRRVRRSGVLREAGALRVSLVWSHPDAELSLWVGLPGLSPTRPYDISPEYGLEAFNLEEQEPAAYGFEVRRHVEEDDLTEVTGQLVVVWNEGEDDEQIELIDLNFERGQEQFAWTITGRSLTQVEE